MKLSANQILTYVLLALLVVVVVIILILSAIQIEDEHEFIKDVRKIKLENGSELKNAICQGKTWCDKNSKFPSTVSKDLLKVISDLEQGGFKDKNLSKDFGVLKSAINANSAQEEVYLVCHLLPSNLSKGLAALIDSLGHQGKNHNKYDIQPNACDKMTKKELDSINAELSFSKLEAKQIYNNNNLIVDNVYNDKDSKECFRNFINVVLVLGKKYSNEQDFIKNGVNSIQNLVKCYNKLDPIKQKYINILVESLTKTTFANLL